MACGPSPALRIFARRMKKGSQLYLLTGLMALSLAGIVAVQGYWVRSSVQLKEEQFAQSVNTALNATVLRLESGDKMSWIKQEVGAAETVKRIVVINGDTLHSSDIPADIELNELHHPPRPGTISTSEESFIINDAPSDSHTGGHVVMRIQESSAVLRSDSGDTNQSLQVTVLPQEQLLQDILVKLARDPRSVRERIDSLSLRKTLAEALAQQDISEPFRFAVSEDPSSRIVLPLVQPDSLPNLQAAYHVKLFPGSLRKESSLLLVDFPSHQSALRQVLGIVLPTTGVLILIIAGVFAFTVSAWRKQKRLSDMKTDFINNMTHELKTPVATISLAAEALGDPDMMRSPDDVARYTRLIQEENERLRQHIERALQNARLEKGQIALQPEMVLLSEALDAQLARIRERVQVRGGEIAVTGVEGMKVFADQRYLSDILFNLLDNAEKYSPTAPMIHVSCKTGPTVEITIADQGTGIPAEHLSRIFEQFYRVPTGNLHDVKGTGLGLSYARSLARLMGGDITVKSESGKGSAFTLTLPKTRKEGEA